MSETCTEICRICLSHNRNDNISDSSCYANFFSQVLSLKNFKEKLLLCMWCKSALRQAMAVFTLALESEKTLQDKHPADIPAKPRSLHSLNYTHNSHIDIPPFLTEYQDFETQNITEDIDELTNPLIEIQDDEIPLKRNRKTVKSTEILNEESISNQNQLTENEIAIKKKNKTEFNFNELKFEVEYLNLEEQLEELDLKKLKYKDYGFQCDLCGMGFHTNEVFEEHLVRHSERSGPHKCSICYLQFKSQDVLSQHTLAHRRRFKCQLCGNVFKRWSHCVAHRHKCGGVVQPIACEECSKIFCNEYSLKIHLKVHKTIKKHCCDLCAKKFGSKQRLTVHMRSHSGIRPFSCRQCARTFTTRSNLSAHSAVHEHTQQFYCVECDTHFKTAKSLKRHFNESAKHASSKNDMYSCKECPKKFSTEKSLNHHVSTRHGTEHRCSQCDKTFSNNSNLNKHIKCIHTAK